MGDLLYQKLTWISPVESQEVGLAHYQTVVMENPPYDIRAKASEIHTAGAE